MKIKVCGITRKQDAELAVELGAWAVGFVFARESRRYIECEAARRIAQSLPSKVEKVGVFVDAKVDTILGTCRAAGLTLAQLHGEESPETVARVGKSLPVIKAVRLSKSSDIARWENYTDVQAFLVDGPEPGSGALADWELARQAKRLGPVFLAGGLNVDNAARAFREVGPEGLDVSSGLESRPGVKDAQMLRRFFEELG